MIKFTKCNSSGLRSSVHLAAEQRLLPELAGVDSGQERAPRGLQSITEGYLRYRPVPARWSLRCLTAGHHSPRLVNGIDRFCFPGFSSDGGTASDHDCADARLRSLWFG